MEILCLHLPFSFSTPSSLLSLSLLSSRESSSHGMHRQCQSPGGLSSSSSQYPTSSEEHMSLHSLFVQQCLWQHLLTKMIDEPGHSITYKIAFASSEEQRGLRPACAKSKADLSLCWAHMQSCRK